MDEPLHGGPAAGEPTIGQPLAPHEPSNGSGSPRPQPPLARRVPHVTAIHGQRLVDDYAWLRDKSHPEVRAYLEAENDYTDAVMAPARALQEKLYAEMLARIKETDVNVPYRFGEFFYYSRTEKGKQYPILCRKRYTLEAEEAITLDVNQLAAGQPFMAVAAYAVSDDGDWLAYSTDNTGFREYTLEIKNLRTGERLPERIARTGSVAWASDNRTLFYTLEDDAKRQYRLYRHQLGSTTDDTLLYEEPDERFNIGVFRTRSRRYLVLESASHTTSEARFLPAANPRDAWQLIAPREQAHEYYLDHHAGDFYIRTNDRGKNFRLVAAPVGSPGRQHWRELVACRADVMLEGHRCFRSFYVLQEREQGLPHLRVVPLDGSGTSRRIEFADAAYSVSGDVNREYDTSKFRYRYQSFVTPLSVYDYDIAAQTSELLKRTEVLGGHDPAAYRVERIFATAGDGTRIPISLVYRQSTKRDGSAPLYVTAYGAYGMPSDVGFGSNRFSLIDRGFVYALAHVRGGGDLGKAWHDAGRMMHKQNTFTDFIAAVEHLLAEGYGARDRVVIEGGSAGGLLMGAVANLRPDLFRAVVSHVPFVDVINTMLDETLPLTVPEYEEWGNPANKAEFEYMLGYSPYDNLERKPYPAMLVKTSFNDSQVMYWEPAKYVARLRTLQTGDRPLLLQTNMGAGHGGASGRYDYLREIAFDYAFLLKTTAIND